MNPELQKSLQVTSLQATLDSYTFVIFLIMIAAGILGGMGATSSPGWKIADKPVRFTGYTK